MNPITQFKLWWEKSKKHNNLKQKNPACLSTIDNEGFPSGRFVDLKEVDENGFNICTAYNSEKGREIEINSKVSLTVWWDHVGFQVRIVGTATKVSEEKALQYWESRSRDAQLASIAMVQSNELSSEAELLEKYNQAKSSFWDKNIEKPKLWGGYIIVPKKIEFLQFKKNRLHIREVFTQNSTEQWEKRLLQP